MATQYSIEREEENNKDPNAPRNGVPKKRGKILVTWDIGGEKTIVRGFNVALTPSYSTPLDNGAIQKVVRLDNPNAREHTFVDVEVDTYAAWVQSIAEGGDSPWRKANSSIEVADDKVPTIRSGDDHSIAAYVEDFRAGARPAGFSFSGITDSYASGEMICYQAAGGGFFRWNLATWLVSKKIDRIMDDKKTATVLLKIKADTIAYDEHISAFLYNQIGAAKGAVDFIANIPLQRDGSFHIVRVPLGRCSYVGFDSLVLDFYSNLNVGEYFRIDAIAVAFTSVDLTLSGEVDAAIFARDQFGKDPTYGGLFLQSPMRPAGTQGTSQLVIDGNGVTWLRDASGSLISENGYKLGRRGIIPDAKAFGLIQWNNAGFGNADSKPQPPLPKPTAHSKVRLMLEPNGAQRTISGATGNVREFTEASEFGANGFTLHYMLFEGGTLAHFIAEAPAGGWSRSNEAKSRLLLSSARWMVSSSGDHANDAWYRSSDELPILTGNYSFYRGVAWIDIQTPLVKKANGSFYWIDLTFDMVRGQANIGVDYMTVDPGVWVACCEGYTARVLSDGKVWRVPIAWGATTQDIGIRTDQASGERIYQNLRADWHTFATESLSGITANDMIVNMMRIEWDYLYGYTNRSFALRQSYIYTYLEEF